MRLQAQRAAAVAMIGLLVACAVLRLDRADLWTPISYTSDALIQGAWAKTLIEQPWIQQNPALAAPFVQEYYDFPLFESVNLAAEKMLGWIGGSWAFAVNAYWILTFPLVAACAYLALVALGVSPLSAALAGVVYTLLPYHLYRGEVHLFLSGYHVVPLCALVAIWIALGELTVARRFRIAVAIMLVTAGSGIYYAFFAAWFLVVASLYAAIRRAEWRPLRPAVLLGILVLAGLSNVAPSIEYWHQNGITTAVRRTPAESTQYGLRLATALMPIPDHRVPALARLRRSLSRAVPSATKVGDGAQSLGALASAGLVMLLAVPFAARSVARETLLALSCLTYAGVLLATTAGLGQLFAVLVAPVIRAWDRIVPFLAFFGLAAVALFLDQASAAVRNGVRRRALAAGAVALGVLAVADQTSPRLVPDYAATKTEVHSDRAFFGDMARSLPPSSMVFQLPYVPFPESPPHHRLADYDLFRPYLSTPSLHWSYGAVRTRFADAWIGAVARRPVSEMVSALVLAGFRGIVVDGYGYEDGGAALNAEIAQLARQRGRNPRYTWYDLDAAVVEQRASLGDAAWETRRNRLLRPIYLEWQRGFHPLEGGAASNRRWSEAESVLAIDNPREKPTPVSLATRVCTGTSEPARITIRSDGLNYSTDATSACAEVHLSLLLPPGRTFIRFATDAPPLDAPGDDRVLCFRLEDFRFEATADADVLENM